MATIDETPRQAARRRWKEANPEQQKEIQRRYDRKRGLQKYGMTLEQWDEMLASQGGICAACGVNEPGGPGTWCVDHDHETNKVRALLCSRCNLTLGMVGDNIDTLLDLVNYLAKQNADI